MSQCDIDSCVAVITWHVYAFTYESLGVIRVYMHVSFVYARVFCGDNLKSKQR